MAESKEINIGMQVKIPKKECNDLECPFHGRLKVHGKVFLGTVKKSKMQNTVTVEWVRYRQVAKYERYERRHTRAKAHNPPCINAHEGDRVKIAECRPLSKTKNFVIVQKIK